MNVLHICCNYAGTTVFRDLFGHLSRAGVAQQVYVPEKRAADMGKYESPAYPVTYSLIVRPWDRALYYTKARRAVPDLRARMDLSRVSLVHAHTLFTDGGIAYRLGLPYVVSVRFTDIEYFYKYMPHLRAYGEKILRAARRVVFLSPESREKVLSRYVKDRAAIEPHCTVMPNGIDAAWLDAAPRPAPEDRVTIGFCGKLTARKQPVKALEAAALYAQASGRRVRFLVAGDGELRQALLDAPQAEGLLDYRGRLGSVDEMKAFYRECDVLLVPSTAETFGLCYLEAMSQGVSVLYTRGQGFDGQFPEGAAGFHVCASDTREMAERIADCLQGYEARSRRCVELSRTLEWSGIAARVKAMYEEAEACGS
jgi:glycosyltransferase involved in cell wall biosynthesis